jgi:hypothetical protein
MDATRMVDIDPDRAEGIVLGESVESFVGQSRCASLGYRCCGGAQCRRFAITMPETGTLEVTVSNGLLDFSVLRPNGTIGANASDLATLGVDAGSTYQIDVAIFGAAPPTFQLTTRLLR